MIQARVQKGRLKLLDPIPESWEGRDVTIAPTAQEDSDAELLEKLNALLELGPAKWAPGEKERIWEELEEQDRISREKVREQMQRIADRDE